MNSELTDAEKEERFKALFERARKGVLAYVNEKGGVLPMAEMHDYSLYKYFIQHQRFSQMMEGFVDEGLVIFDHETHKATITDVGREFIK